MVKRPSHEVDGRFCLSLAVLQFLKDCKDPFQKKNDILLVLVRKHGVVMMGMRPIVCKWFYGGPYPIKPITAMGRSAKRGRRDNYACGVRPSANNYVFFVLFFVSKRVYRDARGFTERAPPCSAGVHSTRGFLNS